MDNGLDYNLLWFFLVGVLLAGYAILDGFDLGVGSLHIFARTDHDRRILLNSIGPVWDGNEVWLVTAGGALFAAFPNAYAAVFSGFYLPFMVLLWALIFRATAIEFRSKKESRVWRAVWDWAFCLASAVASILFGVAVGNMVIGIPIGSDMEFQGTLLGLLRPYALLVGILNLSMFAMHGSLYLYLKTEGDLQQRVRKWVTRTFGFFLVMYVLTTIFSLVGVPNATRSLFRYPWAWGIVVLTVLAIANIPRAIHAGRPLQAFLSSSVMIAGLVCLFGLALYPNLVISSIDSSHNLTAYTAASSRKTLQIMAIIAALGMPLVLCYTSVVYWVFRGKVKIDPASY